MFCSEPAPFEHFKVLRKQSYRMRFRRLSKRRQETVQNMESAVCRVQRTEDRLERSGSRGTRPKMRQRLVRREEYLVRDGICSPLDEMLKASDTERTSLSLAVRYRWRLVDIVKKEALHSLAECVKECASVEGRIVYDESSRIKFVKSRLLDGGSVYFE